MKSLLSPLGLIYSSVMQLRNQMYNRGVFTPKQLPATVVSVGNLTMGGTGKTPIIESLIAWAKAEGIKLGVVSRGYKGKFKGVQKVTLDADGSYFGDEPTMLALRHKDVPVYVGADRVAASRELLSNESVSLILADDAFQHRNLDRDIDVVVIDMMSPLAEYNPLPWGRARESLSSLRRAHFIIFNKVNMVSEEKVQLMKALIFKAAKDNNFKCPPVIEASYELLSIKNIVTGEEIKEFKNKSFLVASGIGQPKSFENLLQQNSIKVLEHMSFPDHYEFSRDDVTHLINKSKSLSLDKILITEKDAVKINKFSPENKMFWSVQLKLKFSENISELHEFIIKKTN